MMFLAARRAVVALVSMTTIVALGLPRVASALEPKPDINEQCSGPSIEGEGAMFQAPADFVLTGFNWDTQTNLTTGYNQSTTNPLACAGAEGQGDKLKPTVEYNQNPFDGATGSRSCSLNMGAGVAVFRESIEEIRYPRLAGFPFCGTDEAPSAAVKTEMEKFAESSSPMETLPLAQGAVTVLVHLPEGCTASSEPLVKLKLKPSGRLALDQATVEGIYRGTIKTWKAVVEAQRGDAKDELHCAGGEAEENDEIHVVVRQDRSGTTHIFKKFLEQVNSTSFEAEKGKFDCASEKPVESKTWEQVSEGCENQRWPVDAHVGPMNGEASGEASVIDYVAVHASSIGYADLANVRGTEFARRGKGGETEKGEENQRFWALIQNNPETERVEYADPSTNYDVEGSAKANCSKTVYIAKFGEQVPPTSVDSDWSQVKGSNKSATYPICGLTYVIAPKLYFPYLKRYSLNEGESREIATSVHDYLHWAVNAKAGGGSPTLEDDHDYERVSGAIQKETELGVEEIGDTIP
jgi:ABC-type phosphate transport system substrate-binding protein